MSKEEKMSALGAGDAKGVFSKRQSFDIPAETTAAAERYDVKIPEVGSAPELYERTSEKAQLSATRNGRSAKTSNTKGSTVGREKVTLRISNESSQYLDEIVKEQPLVTRTRIVTSIVEEAIASYYKRSKRVRGGQEG